MVKMSRRSKWVSAGFLTLTAILLNLDILINNNIHIYFSHVVHCIAEGIIVLMFSRELRGEKWM